MKCIGLYVSINEAEDQARITVCTDLARATLDNTTISDIIHFPPGEICYNFLDNRVAEIIKYHIKNIGTEFVVIGGNFVPCQDYAVPSMFVHRLDLTAISGGWSDAGIIVDVGGCDAGPTDEVLAWWCMYYGEYLSKSRLLYPDMTPEDLADIADHITDLTRMYLEDNINVEQKNERV